MQRSPTRSGWPDCRTLPSPDRRCRRAIGFRSACWAALRRHLRRLGVARTEAAGGRRFTKTRSGAAWARPFNRMFRYRTGLHDLIAQAETADSLKPSGFIFHMSRCGSTLAAQMLAALSDCVVISEAAPIDAVTQLGRALAPRRCRAGAPRHDLSLRPQACRPRAALRHQAGLLAHPRSAAVPARLSRCALGISLPRSGRGSGVADAPARRANGAAVVYQPSFFGRDPAGVACRTKTTAPACSAPLCRAVIDHHERRPAAITGGGLILNYRELPEAVWSAILPHFGMACSGGRASGSACGKLAQRDAKSPTLSFASDTESKQREATDKLR